MDIEDFVDLEKNITPKILNLETKPIVDRTVQTKSRILNEGGFVYIILEDVNTGDKLVIYKCEVGNNTPSSHSLGLLEALVVARLATEVVVNVDHFLTNPVPAYLDKLLSEYGLAVVRFFGPTYEVLLPSKLNENTLLFSGGVDSTHLLFKRLQGNTNTVSFYHGQAPFHIGAWPEKKAISALLEIARTNFRKEIPHQILKARWSCSSPRVWSKAYRNFLMIVQASIAFPNTRIWVGTNIQDELHDCHPDFIRNFVKLSGLEIVTPNLYIGRRELMKNLIELSLKNYPYLYASTASCQLVRFMGGKHLYCGSCHSCLLRLPGIEFGGDPRFSNFNKDLKIIPVELKNQIDVSSYYKGKPSYKILESFFNDFSSKAFSDFVPAIQYLSREWDDYPITKFLIGKNLEMYKAISEQNIPMENLPKMSDKKQNCVREKIRMYLKQGLSRITAVQRALRDCIVEKDLDIEKVKGHRLSGETVKECVARKIPINLKEGMPRNQAIRVSFVQCQELKETEKSLDPNKPFSDATLGDVKEVVRPDSNFLHREIVTYLRVPFSDIFKQLKKYSCYQSNLVRYALSRLFTNQIISTRNFDQYTGEQLPVEYVSFTTGENDLLQGLYSGALFLNFDDNEKIVLVVTPGPFGSMSLSFYGINQERLLFLSNEIDVFIKENNFLRGKKLDAMGQFIVTPQMTWNDVILSKKVLNDLKLNVADFIERIDELEKKGIPTKRGILLIGPPGSGKTFVGKVLANEVKCTFIWVPHRRSNMDFTYSDVYQMARDLSPSIVFIEDLVTQGGLDRRTEYVGNSDLGELLNLLDGIEENSKVVTIATENFPEYLDPALKDRPGRFDFVIELKNPDSDQRREFFTRYDPEIPKDQLDLLVNKTGGLSFSYLRELVTRLQLTTGEPFEETIDSLVRQAKVVISKSQEFDTDEVEELTGVGKEGWVTLKDGRNVFIEPENFKDDLEDTDLIKVALSDLKDSNDVEKLSDKELLNTHHRLHQTFGSFIQNHPGRSVEYPFVNLHVLVVEEFKKRGFNHNIKDKLDEQTKRLMSVAMNWLYEKVESAEDFVLVPNYISVVGSVVNKEEPHDIDIVVREDLNDLKHGWRDSLYLVIRKLLDPSKLGLGIHLLPNAQGPHIVKDQEYVPLFDLVLRPRKQVEFLSKAVKEPEKDDLD